jgi:hypothetical protein
MSTLAAPRLKRQLPGLCAWIDELGRPRYIKGIVVYQSSRIQWVETDSKMVGLVALLADTYLYCCARCPSTVYGQEVEAMRQHDLDCGRMPRPRRCPFCSGPIAPVQRGDRLRLHYRCAANGSSGAWWGERFDW